MQLFYWAARECAALPPAEHKGFPTTLPSVSHHPSTRPSTVQGAGHAGSRWRPTCICIRRCCGCGAHAGAILLSLAAPSPQFRSSKRAQQRSSKRAAVVRDGPGTTTVNKMHNQCSGRRLAARSDALGRRPHRPATKPSTDTDIISCTSRAVRRAEGYGC